MPSRPALDSEDGEEVSCDCDCDCEAEGVCIEKDGECAFPDACKCERDGVARPGW